ncbi:HpcH/HpaI aldolase/citrate lyase family protein [Cereibacter sphaeroides]|uniref:HpcH/HpaI aldolase/citrate lyase family protein n=1 Tax=Cereibacter sphaeroides TaxID=1063 RepID=UPI001F2B238E|nr:HpcH/HpaI aldolase/citrate lyase family protein [Cereibacter sphaeroides]MCE6957756.1 HpcH/HpaI aldolase/citrate lyase family protein [Cereibacter sphaeroides]MCE6971618.1 HpcH/HpaI aldolase/citrate lyase family protein [Cereibacter sphaeroides]
MDHSLHTRALRLGATLYMPVIHPQARRILLGEEAHGAGSVVICLEDALGEADVGRGLRLLKETLEERRRIDRSGQKVLVFVRPRSLAMGREIAAMTGAETLDGFIVPKMTLANGPDWFAIARQSGLPLMPTLETPDMYDPVRVSQVADMIGDQCADHLFAIRIGGNDLLSALGLRRVPGQTSHEGPLAWVLGMIASQMMSRGFPVAAPVYDIISDLGTLEREVSDDAARGFIGKTAIHPCQIPIIHAAFQVGADELRQADAILGDEAAAVFQIGGVMCEPATHRAWARRIRARAAIHGLRDSVPAELMQALHRNAG